MEQAVILASIAFLGNKIIEALKYLRAKDWNGLITLLSVHLTGVLVLLYASSMDVTDKFVVPGTDVALGTLDLASVIFLGLTTASLTSKLYDFQKAVDNSDSAAQPQLTPLSDGESDVVVVP